MKKIFFALVLIFGVGPVCAQNIDLPLPAESVAFGASVKVLPNGNYVITDPRWGNSPSPDRGAVYLFDGQTNALISTLTGSAANDRVGEGGIILLSNGNFVVKSIYWNNGSKKYAGAATWGSAVLGVNGVVNSSNSLVGDLANTFLGGLITPLTNGNYVVTTEGWRSGTTDSGAGAVTWGNGLTGVTGTITSSNSLTGSQKNDRVGTLVTPLQNGNYVVCSPFWNNGTNTGAGAATWCNGITGTTGSVGSSNSLVGSQVGDWVGYGGATALSNGNYVVSSPAWSNGTNAGAGAATWGNGITGVSGAVSSSNSLVGSQAGDNVGRATVNSASNIVALSNGNYVVGSFFWNNGTLSDVGAATWCTGTTGTTGSVGISNSLVGSQANDNVSRGGLTALTNGNYVVNSPYWSNGSMPASGAVTWGSGTNGVTGMVNSSNSLVGSQLSDNVGKGGVVSLLNGNYVVSSPLWSNGAVSQVGAATLGSGTAGLNGPVTTTNSLVGTLNHNRVSSAGIVALLNGNYVVCSPDWGSVAISGGMGAATWCNGIIGLSGPVSTGNSLTGSQGADRVGTTAVALGNGDYVVGSPAWSNGNGTQAGAVTKLSGSAASTGTVSTLNSLVGTRQNDKIGSGGITAVADSSYVVNSPYWKNGIGVTVGATTLGIGINNLFGSVTPCNSVVGMNSSNASDSVFAFNAVSKRLIGSRVAERFVVLFQPFTNGIATTSAVASNTLIGTTEVYFKEDSCSLIARLLPVSPLPVAGLVTATVYTKASVITLRTTEAACRRSYKILPANNGSTATAKGTLYFTQADFDNYNKYQVRTGTPFKLPTSPTDAAGKTALRITQQKGTSTTGDFGSFNGFGGSGPANVLITPGDSNVVWNSSLSCWEVSFPVTGFGGFFLSAGNEAPLALPPNSLSKTNGIIVSPVPATSSVTITNSNAALTGSTFTALNLQGQVMAKTVLEASTTLNIQSWPAGMYLLKFADGSVVKVVKQ